MNFVEATSKDGGLICPVCTYREEVGIPWLTGWKVITLLVFLMGTGVVLIVLATSNKGWMETEHIGMVKEG